ncbi:MAG: DNA-binding response regulator, partial [Deltaproteobacteria bacterium]|nr:DNA-binding response regulator [Deltaproteobacteria bacterium]
MDTKRILIIDDDPDFRYSLRMILESGGYLVDEAASAEDGLR